MNTLKQLTVLVLVGLLLPATTQAARYERDRGWNIDRDDLDNDIVEEFAVPVLFGYGTLTENFGEERDGGARSHEGQDIFAPEGTPIVSPTEAIVIRTGTGDSSGKYVYTANPGGETFRYMHLNSIADIDSGDELDVGALIGTVGDTGNAPDGVYHLHFEIRDEDNEASDPFERLTKTFSLKEKMSFIEDILRDVDDDSDEYAEFLVDTFTADFIAGLKADYDLPEDIIEALEDRGIVSAAKAENDLAATLETIPKALKAELQIGDSSLLVTLLQIYLIYTTEGPARDALQAAGPTGYYGPVTATAVSHYQSEHELITTGVYDNATQRDMADTSVTLNLN